MCRKREAGLNQTDPNTLKEADDLVGFLRLGHIQGVSMSRQHWLRDTRG